MPSAPNFDFVIIGGGLCGLVLASRLSEDKNVSVCLLEAGGEIFHSDTIDVPGWMISVNV
jgi:choline dehydrogenase-like flavoprotein